MLPPENVLGVGGGGGTECVYYVLFAVARWLLCLLSDYKSATCSER